MKKKYLCMVLVISLMLGFVLSSCGSSTATTTAAQQTTQATTAKATTAAATSAATTAASGKSYTVGLFVKDATTPFWRYVVQGAKAESDRLGVKMIEYAPMKNTDTAQQISQVEDAIQSGINAICIVPIDSNAILPALQKAKDAKIPVIIFNSRVTMEGLPTFVGVDNYQGSYNMTERMFKDMNYQGNLVILESDPAAYVNKERVRAVTDLVKKYPNVKILTSQPAYARRDTAMQVMENILQTYSKIDMVWSLNDATALGAIQAIEAAKRTGIKVSGFDGTPEGIQAILDGKMAYSLDQSPYQQGQYSIRAAVDVLNGKTIEKEISTGGTVVDKANGQEILDKFYKQ